MKYLYNLYCRSLKKKKTKKQKQNKTKLKTKTKKQNKTKRIKYFLDICGEWCHY